MTTFMTIRGLAAALAAVCLVGLATITVQAAPDEGVIHSATGSGQLRVFSDAPLRTFGFSAVMHADGTVTGHAEAQARQDPNRWQVDVNCLKVVGNVAIVSGFTTRHTVASDVGWTGGFAVEDNGEGPGVPPDRITRGFFFEPGTVTCQDFGLDDVAPFLLPVEDGGLQVR